MVVFLPLVSSDGMMSPHSIMLIDLDGVDFAGPLGASFYTKLVLLYTGTYDLDVREISTSQVGHSYIKQHKYGIGVIAANSMNC